MSESDNKVRMVAVGNHLSYSLHEEYMRMRQRMADGYELRAGRIRDIFRAADGATVGDYEDISRPHKLLLMSMADNRKYSRHAKIREEGYRKYDNFDALEVPFVDAIPYDYDGIMGVPITYMDHLDSDSFEIVGIAHNGNSEYDDLFEPVLDGKKLYARILIRRTAWFTDNLRRAGMID